MASLRKRKHSDYWVCCYTLPDGTRSQRSTGQTEHKKGMALCLQWEEETERARRGEFTESQARKVLNDISLRAGLGHIEFATTRKFFTDWINSKEISKASGTFKRYDVIVKSFITHLDKRADLNLAAIRASDIQSFRDAQVKEGKSNGSANMAVKTLRIALNLARRQGLILTNPTEAVDLLAANKQTRGTFSRDQITALLGVADQEWCGMILIGVCHGLRLGDAAHLTWANINAERQSLHFTAKKTSGGQNSTVEEYPLHPDVIDYLHSLAIDNNDPKTPLFPSLFKKRLNGRNGVSETFRNLMHKAGIFTEGEASERKVGKGRRFFELGYHSFRHTAISEQANRGVSKEIRMKLSGHKSNVHEKYTHHELEALRREIQRVPSFCEQKPPEKGK